MILMNKIFIDLQGFDDTQFGIFQGEEQEELLNVWEYRAHRNVNSFIGMLSPSQKKQMAIWAAERTSYPMEILIRCLKEFVKYLEKSTQKSYPKKKKNIREWTVVLMLKKMKIPTNLFSSRNSDNKLREQI